jgi:hypothetical protein
VDVGEPRRGRRLPRSPRVRARRLAVTAIILVALGGAVFGVVAGLRHVYFIGGDRGLVTLYRGVPYDLPLGIKLYQSRYVSSVPVRALSPVERRRLLDHQLRSKKDASDLIRRLERGKGL